MKVDGKPVYIELDRYNSQYIKEQGLKAGAESPVWEVEMKLADQIKYIDEAMKPIEEDTTVYRGSLGTEDWKFKPGDVFEDKGFVSTSVDVEKTKRFGVDFFEIHLPKGTPAVYADMYSEVSPDFDDPSVLRPPRYKGTGEVLLGRGLNYQYVEDKVVNGTTVHVFEAGPAGSFKKQPKKSLSPKVNQAKYKEAEDKNMKRFAWKPEDLLPVS